MRLLKEFLYSFGNKFQKIKVYEQITIHLSIDFLFTQNYIIS